MSQSPSLSSPFIPGSRAVTAASAAPFTKCCMNPAVTQSCKRVKIAFLPGGRTARAGWRGPVELRVSVRTRASCVVPIRRVLDVDVDAEVRQVGGDDEVVGLDGAERPPRQLQQMIELLRESMWLGGVDRDGGVARRQRELDGRRGFAAPVREVRQERAVPFPVLLQAAAAGPSSGWCGDAVLRDG